MASRKSSADYLTLSKTATTFQKKNSAEKNYVNIFYTALCTVAK
jgi:hypothetical protein